MNCWPGVDSERGLTVCSCAPTSESIRFQQSTGQTQWITEQNEQRWMWERDCGEMQNGEVGGWVKMVSVDNVWWNCQRINLIMSKCVYTHTKWKLNFKNKLTQIKESYTLLVTLVYNCWSHFAFHLIQPGFLKAGTCLVHQSFPSIYPGPIQ